MLAMTRTEAGRTADWTQQLDAGASYGFVSNPLLRPQGGADEGQLLVNASGRLAAAGERSQWALAPSFSASRYSVDRAYDYTNGSLETDFKWQQERVRWNFTAQGVADTTLTSEQALTGLTQSNRDHRSALFNAGVEGDATERVTLFSQLLWTTNQYFDATGTGLQDYQYGSLQFGPAISLTERLKASLVMQAADLSLRDGTSQKDSSASLRINHSITEGLKWQIEAGRTLIDFGNRTAGTLLLNANASLQREHVSWSVSAQRDVEPLGVGLLTTRDQAALTASDDVTEHLTLAASLSVSRTEPANVQQRVVFGGWEFGQLEGQLHWRFARRWTLTLDASGARSRGGSTGPWAQGSQARVGLAWHEDSRQ
jgi:hypothetical protein